MLAAQLDRISSLSTLRNVSIGVLPFGVRATVPYSHSFIIYETPDDDENDFVNIEMIHANTYLKSETDVDIYRKRWDGLERLALHEDEARLFLNDLGREIRERDA